MGIYPIDGVIGAIEVTSKITKRKWLTDCAKLMEFRQLLPSSFLQSSALPPAGMMFAADADSSLRTVGDWVATRFTEVREDERQYLPNCVVVLEKGLVCYLEIENGVVKLSFNPINAGMVAVIESPQLHLGVFLHLLLHELRRVLASRMRGYLLHLLKEAHHLPHQKGGLIGLESETIQTTFAITQQLADAAAFFPDYATYLGDDLSGKLADSLHRIPVGP